jgi:hypothetical protein
LARAARLVRASALAGPAIVALLRGAENGVLVVDRLEDFAEGEALCRVLDQYLARGNSLWLLLDQHQATQAYCLLARQDLQQRNWTAASPQQLQAFCEEQGLQGCGQVPNWHYYEALRRNLTTRFHRLRGSEGRVLALLDQGCKEVSRLREEATPATLRRLLGLGLAQLNGTRLCLHGL